MSAKCIYLKYVGLPLFKETLVKNCNSATHNYNSLFPLLVRMNA